MFGQMAASASRMYSGATTTEIARIRRCANGKQGRRMKTGWLRRLVRYSWRQTARPHGGVASCILQPPSSPAGMMPKSKQTKSKQPRTNLTTPTTARTRGSRRSRMAGRTARSRRTRRRGTRRRARRVRARRPSRPQAPEKPQGWRKPRRHPEAARVMTRQGGRWQASKQASKSRPGLQRRQRRKESAGGQYFVEAGSSALCCLSR